MLFVSHNMAAITQLCTRALLLRDGTICAEGDPDQVISTYLASANQEGRINLGGRNRPLGAGGAAFEWAELRNKQGDICQDFSIGEDITVAFGLRLGPDRPRTKLAVTLRAADGTPLAHVADQDSGFSTNNDLVLFTVAVQFEDVRFYPGEYRVTIWVSNIANTEVLDVAEDCLTFRILDGGKLTMRSLPRHWGILFLTPTWTTEPAVPADGDWSGPAASLDRVTTVTRARVQ